VGDRGELVTPNAEGLVDALYDRGVWCHNCSRGEPYADASSAEAAGWVGYDPWGYGNRWRWLCPSCAWLHPDVSCRGVAPVPNGGC
jgi:hypothetical protein